MSMSNIFHYFAIVKVSDYKNRYGVSFLVDQNAIQVYENEEDAIKRLNELKKKPKFEMGEIAPVSLTIDSRELKLYRLGK